MASAHSHLVPDLAELVIAVRTRAAELRVRPHPSPFGADGELLEAAEELVPEDPASVLAVYRRSPELWDTVGEEAEMLELLPEIDVNGIARQSLVSAVTATLDWERWGQHERDAYVRIATDESVSTRQDTEPRPRPLFVALVEAVCAAAGDSEVVEETVAATAAAQVPEEPLTVRALFTEQPELWVWMQPAAEEGAEDANAVAWGVAVAAVAAAAREALAQRAAR